MARKRDKPNSPPPTAEFVMSLYDLRQHEGDETRLRLMAQNFRLLTKMEHQLNIPEAYKAVTKEVRTPYVRDAWLRITAALTQKPASIHIEPGDAKTASKDATSIAERWDLAAIERLNRDLGEDAVFESAKALIRDGESVLKTVHRPDAWAKFPRRDKDEPADQFTSRTTSFKRGAPLPFAWRTVDRLSMLFGDGEYGDDWALEYGEYPMPYLGRRYGMATADVDGQRRLVHPDFLLGGKPKPEGELTTAIGRSVKVEYWDADWWHVVIDGSDAPGWPKPNPYAPKLPYHRAKAADSESMLYSLLFLVPALDELITMKLGWSYLGAYPNPIVKAVPNVMTGQFPLGDANETPKVSWKVGKEIVLPPGWDIQFLAPPPVGADLNQLILLFSNLIDIAGIPSVFRGVGGSDQAGYAINQLMAAASLAFRIAAANLQRQFEKALEFYHWLIPNHIHQTVYVLGSGGEQDEGRRRWLGLKPDGEPNSTEAPVTMLGPIEFRLKPTLPTDEQARAMIANNLVNAPKPLISRRYALEHFLQVEDADGMADEIALEQALEEEPLRGLVMQNALREAGLLPEQQAPQLVGPNGQPISSGALGNTAGVASVPGLNMPLQPTPPGAPGGMAGRPAGAFPGAPPSQPGAIPVAGG